MHIDGVCCPTIQIWSKFGEVLHESGLTSTLDPQLLGFWVVMNMINSGIAAGGSPGLLAPPSLGP